MQRSKIIDKLRDRLLAELSSEILRITIFGSQARDEATAESDLDVFIVVREASPTVIARIRNVRYDLMEQHNFQPLISLVILERDQTEQLRNLGSRFLATIQDEGIDVWAA